MNEAQLDAFLTIARCGAFSRAAEILNLTQPTVSHRIRTLEEETGLKLFTRGPVSCELTPAGQAFLPEAERLEKDFAAARRALKPFNGSRQMVIGFPLLMVQGPFAAYQAVMGLSGTGFHLKAQIFHAPADGLNALSCGDADIIFADPDQACFSGGLFSKRDLFVSGAYICVHRGHRLADRPSVFPGDLKGETVLTCRDSTFFTETALNLIGPDNVTVLPGRDSAERTARRLRPDGGVMLANTRLIDEEWLFYVPLTLPRALKVGLIWLKKTETPELLRLTERIAALPGSLWRT